MAVALGATAIAAAVTRLLLHLAEYSVATSSGDFEPMLVTVALIALIGCTVWAWSATLALAWEALRSGGRASSRLSQGLPASARRLILALCGVTLAASTAPAMAGAASPSDSWAEVRVPTSASTSTADRSGPTAEPGSSGELPAHVVEELVQGLPLPDRATDDSVSPPAPITSPESVRTASARPSEPSGPTVVTTPVDPGSNGSDITSGVPAGTDQDHAPAAPQRDLDADLEIERDLATSTSAPGSVRTTTSTTPIIVAPGDSLWSVSAQQFPGAPARFLDRAWRELYDLNRERIGADPSLIMPGLTLAVPKAWR